MLGIPTHTHYNTHTRVVLIVFIATDCLNSTTTTTTTRTQYLKPDIIFEYFPIVSVRRQRYETGFTMYIVYYVRVHPSIIIIIQYIL